MKIVIRDESIKVGQLLKKIHVVQTGGDAKLFLVNNVVKVNGKPPVGRGSKVYVGDTVWINDDLYQIVNE